MLSLTSGSVLWLEAFKCLSQSECTAWVETFKWNYMMCLTVSLTHRWTDTVQILYLCSGSLPQFLWNIYYILYTIYSVCLSLPRSQRHLYYRCFHIPEFWKTLLIVIHTFFLSSAKKNQSVIFFWMVKAKEVEGSKNQNCSNFFPLPPTWPGDDFWCPPPPWDPRWETRSGLTSEGPLLEFFLTSQFSLIPHAPHLNLVSDSSFI